MDNLITHEMLDNEQKKYFAVSKDFAKAIKSFSKNELKTLFFALTKVNCRAECPKYVDLDKRKLADFLGIHSNSTHFSQDLLNEIKSMPRHSAIQYYDEASETWVSTVIIRRIETKDRSNNIRFVFEEVAYKYFGGLLNGQFILMLAQDIEKLTSVRSILLYEFLRAHSDTRVTNTFTISTKELKTMFDIPKTGKGAYMTKDGHFQRYEFEKKVLDPICEDLSKCSMIKLVVNDGKYYSKVKDGSLVSGYRLTWVVNQFDYDEELASLLGDDDVSSEDEGEVNIFS